MESYSPGTENEPKSGPKGGCLEKQNLRKSHTPQKTETKQLIREAGAGRVLGAGPEGQGSNQAAETARLSCWSQNSTVRYKGHGPQDLCRTPESK